MNSIEQCASILIVEDDEMILLTLKELLEGEGYHVFTAKNGVDALTALETRVKQPCLILLDMFMPIMDGWQFLEQLKTTKFHGLASIPIVITSAAGDRAKEAAKQVNAFIKKPIDLNILLLVVEKYCGISSSSANSNAS